MAKRKAIMTPVTVVATYEHLLETTGKASCGMVADELQKEGFYSPLGRPVSRMAVWRMLQYTKMGRNLLARTKERIGRDNDNRATEGGGP